MTHRSRPVLARLGLIAAAAMLLAGVGASPAYADTIEASPVAGSPIEVRFVTAYNGLLYFAGDNGADIVLYSTDGTTVTEVPGSPTNPAYLFAHDGVLYFQAIGAGGNTQLFSFTGSAFTEIPDADDPGGFTDFGGTLYFYAEPDGINRLFRLVAGAAVEVPGTPDEVEELGVANGLLYFSGSNATSTVLYYYDGINPPIEVPSSPTTPDSLTDFNGRLYFTAFDGTDWQLYSHTIAEGVLLVPGSAITPYRLTVFGDTLYFGGNIMSGPTLYSFDGVTLTPIDGSPETPDDFFVHEGSLYFSAWSPTGERLPYVYDGTSFTAVLGDAYYPGYFADLGGELFFGAFSGIESETRTLFRLVVVPTSLLAPAGSAPEVPLGLAALLLLGGALAIAVARRPRRSALGAR